MSSKEEKLVANKTTLVSHERERLDALIRRQVDTMDARQNGTGLKELLTGSVIDTLELAAADGDADAEHILRGLAIDGLRERVAVLLKTDDRCLIARNGAVLSMPARWGVRRHEPNGVRQKHYQQRLWWELTWAEFADMVDGLRRQAARLGEEAGAWGEVLRLHDRFPETQTPGEACERAGIDPHEFKLAEAM